MTDHNFGFSLFLWILITLFLFAWSRPFYRPNTGASSSSASPPDPTAKDQEIAELLQQCQRLRTELEQKSSQNSADFKDITFEELQTLLTNYPTACHLAEAKPELPAKNLIALFTPLENLISSWGYQTIGQVWEQVNYDPQIHQADDDEIPEGEKVYIRFVGYRDGERILVPAKVSQTLPPGV
jgi:molecular chaperone GrpE (heat shock protein)